MSVKDLYPISGDHAIQSAVFALEWAGQLTPVDLDKVRALAPKFQRHGSTPRILDQKSLLINFSDLATGGGVSTKQQDFGGLRFEWIGKLSTVSRTLTVNESGCVVND
jgi:hypothetical protein